LEEHVTDTQSSKAVYAEVFNVRDTPLLAVGRTDHLSAAADSIVARTKVYASGGENSTHAHVSEDHLFLVLQGRARFHLDRDGSREVEVGALEGVLVPAGAFYRFESVGHEPGAVPRRDGQARRGPADRGRR
jgi:mannose-6-phosphate isomerase-like protein (cupin superfamily)